MKGTPGSAGDTTSSRSGVRVANLSVHFRGGRNSVVRAVDGVDFSLQPGETLGIIGESGSGKSTLARALIGLVPAAGGKIEIDGIEVTGAGRAELKRLRRRVSLVFQDPYSTLDPRLTARRLIAEPLLVAGCSRAEAYKRAEDLTAMVDLPGTLLPRRPREMSGGQRQRVCIARALALEPSVLICDEATSALDVSTQAAVLKLLVGLQRSLGFSLILVTHDLSVASVVCDWVAVMYRGKIVEYGRSATVIGTPVHPYTLELMRSHPDPANALSGLRPPRLVDGEFSAFDATGEGCHFYGRCPRSVAICQDEEPQMRLIGEVHEVACFISEPLRDAPSNAGPTDVIRAARHR